MSHMSQFEHVELLASLKRAASQLSHDASNIRYLDSSRSYVSLNMYEVEIFKLRNQPSKFSMFLTKATLVTMHISGIYLDHFKIKASS